MSIKWRLGLAVMVVFLAGLATGVFACAWHMHHLFLERHSGHLAERMREHLRHELQLTPAELEKLQPIISRTANELEAIRNETGRRVSETLEQSRREIAPQLTGDQQKKLDRMAERHRHVFHKRFHSPPPDAPHD